ncbi:MAG: hypothetical protein K0R57_1377 [Paenibacillaceae bacterium]|jgi:hypothetical protein|nr:hypothetical protein [Paenibacillaceae bacterium]
MKIRNCRKWLIGTMALGMLATGMPVMAASDEVQQAAQAPLQIGNYVQFGAYNEAPVLWRVIHRDEDGKALLYAEHILSLKPLDADGDRTDYDGVGLTDTQDVERFYYGSNYWLQSNLREWLNSDAAEVAYTAQAPDNFHVAASFNDYAEEAGFLSGFSEQEKQAIQPTGNRVYLSTADSSRKEAGSVVQPWNGTSLAEAGQAEPQAFYLIATDRVFLPSAEQLKMWVLDQGFPYVRTPTAQAVSQSEFKNDSLLSTSSPWTYWLRDPYTETSYGMRVVAGSGSIVASHANSGSVGVVPALYLKAGATVAAGAGTTEDPFTITWSSGEEPQEPGPGPVDPGEPGPVDPGEPGPVDPGEPGPVDPGEPGPVNPVEPGPVNPGEPGPVDPGEPGPVNPGEPASASPTPAPDNPQHEVQLAATAVQVTDQAAPDGRVVRTAALDEEMLRSALALLEGSQAGNPTAVLTLSDAGADAVRVEIPAGMLAEEGSTIPNAVLAVRTETKSYKLPLKGIPVEALAGQLNADPQKLKIVIVLENADPQTGAQMVRQAASEGVQIISEMVEFRVIAEAVGKATELKDFGGAYVTRGIMVTGKVDQTKATGVLYDPAAGEFSFAPTYFAHAGGKTEAQIKRNGNSIYTVIQTDRTFGDIKGHWAKREIEQLASKLVISGVSAEEFAPERPITRAEFAALLIRSLGLLEKPADPNLFTDVQMSDWYAEAVAAAVQADLFDGFEDGAFRPGHTITREQMAVAVTRALHVTGEQTESGGKVSGALASFEDYSQIQPWAQEAVAEVVRRGIMNGVSGQAFVPHAPASQAEAAVVLKRMLQAVRFIN